MKKNIYVCNCLFDADLVSLQLNDSFTDFISRCKLSLQPGFGFIKRITTFMVFV